MFLGIDVGTSGVKAVLLNEANTVVAQASSPLEISRPRPRWSEQNPDDWWRATNDAVMQLARNDSRAVAGIEGIGLTGQMHGATLLDRRDEPLRPAILWNDGRSYAECEALEVRVPDARRITGNLAMPGFTAPKLLWVRKHEPEVFARIAHVLLPKDYVRLLMSGDHATDLSDASGTLWVDVARRRWSETMLQACGLTLEAMPSLHEGPEPTGRLRANIAKRWGCGQVPIVAGAGDNAAGAVGMGVVKSGRALLSLGTSGVYFVANDSFRPNPANAVHAFCHALPDQWHQMSVLLSAASCLSWVAKLTHADSEAALLDEIEARDEPSGRLLFLPYLSGERTPHNDANATGVFVGLNHETDRARLGRAVLEGVAFAFADAQRVLLEPGSEIDSVSVIGGGTRSKLWGRILASALGRPLIYRRGADVGPALGAARLARLGVLGEPIDECCKELEEEFVMAPDPSLVDHYAGRMEQFQALYPTLRETFRNEANESQEN
jgi:xylulokinase